MSAKYTELFSFIINMDPKNPPFMHMNQRWWYCSPCFQANLQIIPGVHTLFNLHPAFIFNSLFTKNKMIIAILPHTTPLYTRSHIQVPGHATHFDTKKYHVLTTYTPITYNLMYVSAYSTLSYNKTMCVCIYNSNKVVWTCCSQSFHLSSCLNHTA